MSTEASSRSVLGMGALAVGALSSSSADSEQSPPPRQAAQHACKRAFDEAAPTCQQAIDLRAALSRRRFLASTVCSAFLAAAGLGCRPSVSADARRAEAAAIPDDARIAGESDMPRYVELEQSGQLAELERELWGLYSPCRLCPRLCGAKRAEGEKGVCGLGKELVVASYGPHFGEEAPLVGRNGSGTIFLSHCNLLCLFCQNWEIAHEGEGDELTHERLAELMLQLAERGVHNINWVTPTHVLPHLVSALRIAAGRGLQLPVVYNCGGYERVEVIRRLEGVIDIYMPDFKFTDEAWAGRLAPGADDYPARAAEAIIEMNRQVGPLQLEQGLARRGLLLRHLVLPNDASGSKRFVQWVADELGTDTYVNIMAQYRPAHRAAEIPEISRRLRHEEYETVLALARAAGLERLD